MRAIFGMLGLVIAVAIVYWIYSAQYGGEHGNLPPKQQIDVTGVRMDLMALSQAERRYAALHGSYATLEELQQEESVPFKGTENRGYTYEINFEDVQSFRITATPVDPERIHWPTLSIDQMGQLSTSK